MGVLPVIIPLNGIFPEINHPAIGVPPTIWKPLGAWDERGGASKLLTWAKDGETLIEL